MTSSTRKGRRLGNTTDWVIKNSTKNLSIDYFGASTEAGAVLVAA